MLSIANNYLCGVLNIEKLVSWMGKFQAHDLIKLLIKYLLISIPSIV